jgi:crotonobetainyl-CoA:carnitine CoA-transferase CaiB-like acyl-CoA transferase
MTPEDRGSSPLDGVLVIALEQAVSGPYCTRQLADLGARVIKVENQAGGDFARSYDDVVAGTSAHFAWANRGKESVVLDLKDPVGRHALEQLVATADVLVQNLAPGAAARLGLDARSLLTRYPRLIAVDVSGYGRGGPMESARAYDLLVQAEAGSCALTGTADARVKPGIPLADIGAGMHAAQAVLAALLQRERTGSGSALSVGMFDVVTDWAGWALNQARYGGQDPVPNGLSSPMVAPYGAYRTNDGQVVVLGTTNDGEWRRLAQQVLGRADLAEDPRYARNADRVLRRPELDEAITAWTSRHSLAEARAAAEQAGLGHARLNTVSDVLEHPQLVERDRWCETECPGGSFLSLRSPVQSDTWDVAPGPVPALGQHTEAVLAELTDLQAP